VAIETAPPITGAAAAQARRLLVRRIEEEARPGALQTKLSVAPQGGTRLSAAGDEAAVLGFINRLERGTPAVRFARWRLEPVAGGGEQVRLAFTATATLRPAGRP
jgi:hypothetical protein